MEVALEELPLAQLPHTHLVSILVLMEVALEELMQIVLLTGRQCFNPCFNGSCFGSCDVHFVIHCHPLVSILVLMEVALEVTLNPDVVSSATGFNPCFNGSCFGRHLFTIF